MTAHADHPNVLEIDNLSVYFDTEDGTVRAVDGVNLAVPRGKTVAVVGESGCGKSVTAYSVLRLVQKPGRLAGGSITLFPQSHEPVVTTDLNEKSRELSHVRGGWVSMVFQEPMTALSPVHTIGFQLVEALRIHSAVSRDESRKLAIEMLGMVGIPDPAKRIDDYSFQFSGGMRQRVMIAIALICKPDLIIADEPTTALDVTSQAQILLLIKQMQKSMGCSLLLITHDLGVVAQMADEVAVMYLGRVVEKASVKAFYALPRHPYTMDLMGSLPTLCFGQRLRAIKGGVPSMFAIPSGCPFHPRCKFVVAGKCDCGGPPELQTTVDGGQIACFRAGELEMEHNSMLFASMSKRLMNRPSK